MLWSFLILAVALVGIVALRAMPKRVRIAFDVVCLVGLSAVLYRAGLTPLFHQPLGAMDAPTVWTRGTAIAWWLLSARVTVSLMYFALHHERNSRETRLFFDLIAAAIYICTGLIVVKSVLVLPIGGVLATSGIVAIVLGLAMQNTLADVFAGIAVGIEAPFQVGHRVSLGKNLEGQVVEMNWRSVRIQTDGADIAIVPNSVVAKLEVVNRSVPNGTRSESVRLWCPAMSDPDKVIAALNEAPLLCPGVLETPSPAAALTQIGPAFNGYTISFSVADTRHLSPTKSLLLRCARKQLYSAGLLAGGSRRRGRISERLSARQLLSELVLFEALEPEVIDNLAKQVVTRLVEPTDTLFAEGAADCTLYVIASGVLEVTKASAAGADVTLGRLGAGEYLGEIGLLTGAPHAATARALTHCYVHQLSRDAVGPLLSANPGMLAAFDQSVRRGMELLNRRVAASTSQAVRGRGELLERIRTFLRVRFAE
jgi:small-conductance mechanosensitive channel/CRP-like cAMP-binding protein